MPPYRASTTDVSPPADIRQQKRNLETIESQLKAYKDEYERLSDWLQAADVQVKQHKTVFVATREEKQQLVDKIKVGRRGQRD